LLDLAPASCYQHGEGFGADFESFMGVVSSARRKQHVWRNLLQVLVHELNHLKQQRKALQQASQLCCFGLQMQFVNIF